MTDEKVVAVIEDVTRAVVENLNAAIKASGNAINPSRPLYIGSETHVKALVRAVLDEMNAHCLFVKD